MDIHISPHDGVPIYLQIVHQVKYLAASPADRLTRVKSAGDLPAFRTYEEIEGVVRRGGLGSAVPAAAAPARAANRAVTVRIATFNRGVRGERRNSLDNYPVHTSTLTPASNGDLGANPSTKRQSELRSVQRVPG